MTTTNTNEIHRTLPHSIEAEKGCLASMLLGGSETIEDIGALLTPDYFYHPAHALIFQFLNQLHHARMPVDFITLTQSLRDVGELDNVGGAAEITELFTFLPTAANAAHYAEIVREKYVLREMIKLATNIAGRAYDQQDQLSVLLEEFQGRAIELGMNTADANAMRKISKAEVMAELESIEARYHNRGRPMGLPTGFADYDRMTDGLKPGEVTVLAGRPAMGKSSIGMNICENIAIAMAERNQTVAFFAVEMTRAQMVRRIVMNQAGLSLQRLRDGFLSEADFPKLQQAAVRLIQGKILLDDTSGLTIAQFRSRARRAVLKDKAKLLIVDHLHKMKGTSKRGFDNRSLELAEIMQGISETAKQLHVPIIVLAQLGRGAAEKGDTKPPSMNDLEWSSVIEQEAHVVGLLHRPIYYAKTDEARTRMADKYDMPLEDLLTYAELIIDKQRDGAVGTVKLIFKPELTRFESRTKSLYSNNEEEHQK